MKMCKLSILVAVLCFGLLSSVQSLAAVGGYPSEDIVSDLSFSRSQYCTLNDGVPAVEENYGYTVQPEYEALEVCGSDDPGFEYMAHSLYYTVYFKGKTVKMSVHDMLI